MFIHHVLAWGSLLLLLALENIRKIRNVIVFTVFEIRLKEGGEDESQNIHTTSYSGHISLLQREAASWYFSFQFSLDLVYIHCNCEKTSLLGANRDQYISSRIYKKKKVMETHDQNAFDHRVGQ